MKKILALILCLISIFSLFYGCGQRKNVAWEFDNVLEMQDFYEQFKTKNEERFLISSFNYFEKVKYTFKAEKVDASNINPKKGNALFYSPKVFFQCTNSFEPKSGVFCQIDLRGELIDISNLSLNRNSAFNFYEQDENMYYIKADDIIVAKVKVDNVVGYGKLNTLRFLTINLESAFTGENQVKDGTTISYSQVFQTYDKFLEFNQEWSKYNDEIFVVPNLDAVEWNNQTNYIVAGSYNMFDYQEVGWFCDCIYPSFGLEVYSNSYTNKKGEPLCVAMAKCLDISNKDIDKSSEIIFQQTSNENYYYIKAGNEDLILLSVNKEKLGIDIEDFFNYLIEACAFK